jgi:hypothetical protein
MCRKERVGHQDKKKAVLSKKEKKQKKQDKKNKRDQSSLL